MINNETYTILIAASVCAGVVFAAVATLWFVLKDVRGAWKLIHADEGRGQLSAAAERQHAMRVIRKDARKRRQKIETLEVAALEFLDDDAPDPWPPIPMRPVMPDGQRTLLMRCLVPCEKTPSAGGGIRLYASSQYQLQLNA